MRYFYFSLFVFISLLFSGCSSMWYLSTNDDPIYRGVEVDTITSEFELQRKLRTDFSFRWDFAQYAMTRPLSWYWNNPRLDGIWRPYNRFDIWFNSHQFWYDWVWGYSWNPYYNRPWYWRYYDWYTPRPWGWNTWSHYNYDWYNQPNVSHVVGRRGSRYNDLLAGNSIIQDSDRNRRGNRSDNNIDRIIKWSDDNDIPNRIITRPDENGIIINVKPRVSNNNFNTRPPVINNSGRPPINNNSVRPVIRNNSGGSSTQNSSGGSSRGKRGNN